VKLDDSIERAGLWRASALSPAVGRGIPTGFAALDNLLPAGGWPAGALTEILADGEGIGALQLVMPALARLSRGDRWLSWIAPPHIPYAPALASAGLDLSRVLLVHDRLNRDHLWAMEQALRSGASAAVLGWFARLDVTTARRLQLAAEAGDSWGVLFRPARFAGDPSPAALRLRLGASRRGTLVKVLKCRGGWPGGACVIDRPDDRAEPERAASAIGDGFVGNDECR
jgi:hypothetical protein